MLRIEDSSIMYYDTLGSTMDQAYTLFEKGKVPPITVVSERQTKGRGQFSRVWDSPKGGLFFSMFVKPEFVTVDSVPVLMDKFLFLLQSQILQISEVHTTIKLPNDIMYKGKKLGGVLLESSTLTDSDILEYLNIGIGLNVNQESFPLEIYESSTSLKMITGQNFSIKYIAESIVDSLNLVFKSS